MLLADIQQEALLLPGEHRAGGVAGVGDHDGLGAGGDEGFNLLPAGEAVALLRRGGDGHDFSAGDADEGVVIGIEGLGNQDLVPVVQDAGGGELESLAPAVSGQDVLKGQGHAEALVIALHGLQVFVHAAGGSIGQNGIPEAPHGVKECLGGLHVGLSDVQMEDAPPGCLRRHHIGVEFPNGGEAARLAFAGKLHPFRLLGALHFI